MQSTSNRLKGKVAVVTGGNSGIGLATAEQFVAEGADVIITGRRQKELDSAIKKIGRNVTAIQGDISNYADLDRLYDKIKSNKGRVDILFANAGLWEYAPLGKISEEHYDKIFNINVKGLLFTVQKLLPLMPDGSSIILNASIASIKGVPDMSVYCASKAAVRSFARTWTNDLKSRKIRVNAISPGPILTPGIERSGLPEEKKKENEKYFTSAVPMGRFGQPDEIAKAVVFLASDESSYVTGIDLSVDGGMAQI